MNDWWIGSSFFSSAIMHRVRRATQAEEKAAELLDQGLQARTFSGAAYLVGTLSAVNQQGAVGTTSWEGGMPVTLDTVWDIASLTKPIVALEVMRLIERGELSLDDPIRRFLPDYRLSDKADITLEQLLTHTSGIPGQQPLYRTARTREQLLEAVRDLPLRCAPGTGVEYTSQGFMIVGQVVEAVWRQPLDIVLERDLLGPLGMRSTCFRPPPSWEPRIAATERCPCRGRLIKGTVHDENAEVLGGIAGHAGLFSTAGDLARLARCMLGGGHLEGTRVLAQDTVDAMARPRTDHLALRRCLGWQGADDSGCPAGTCVSRDSYGHTGFTGTSLWIDPRRELFVILLTNAVHPQRDPERMRTFRPRFHDAVLCRGES